MTYFPQIGANHSLGQLPNRVTRRFRTVRNDLVCGTHVGYSQFTQPQVELDVLFGGITESESGQLEAFYLQQRGPLLSFTFLDPGGNLVQQSELFSDPSWHKTQLTVSPGLADPFSGLAGMLCTALDSTSNLSTLVLPDGNAQGLVVCGSVFVKALSAGETFSIAIGDGSAAFDSVATRLVAGVWTRVAVRASVTSSQPVQLSLGGFSTSGTVLFGAQCVPLDGPGTYLRSPDFFGLRKFCRFSEGELDVVSLEQGRVKVRTKILQGTGEVG